jgi:RimJ/RimL family protein N-acetyltransferase
MWTEKGYGLFAVESLETKSFIGFTGFSEPAFLPEIMPAIEIGWRFERRSWGNGFATEAATAALNFGLFELGLSEIFSIYQIENRASGRIMQKLGMRFDRETIDKTCDRLVRVYRTV